MGLRKQLWTTLVDDDENGGSVVPIFALAYEHDPDPEMRSYDKPVSPELRKKLIIGAAAAVMRIYRYFQERRFTATYATGNSTTYQRTTTKVGRNEPCPAQARINNVVAGSPCIDIDLYASAFAVRRTKVACSAGHQSVAIVLDLVDPSGSALT